MGSAPKEGVPVQKDDNIKIMAILPNDDTVFVPTSEFPSTHLLGTANNPVNSSNAPTEASNMGACPQGVDSGGESKILSHFSDALDEMAQSITGLEDSYFMALREVIHTSWPCEKSSMRLKRPCRTYLTLTQPTSAV